MKKITLIWIFVFVISLSEAYAFNYPPVVNLTFDNSTEPWKDYGSQSINFKGMNGANISGRGFCKWFGCANFTNETRGNPRQDMINGSLNITSMNGMAISMWLYCNESPSGSGNSMGFFIVGGNGSKPNTRKTMQQGDYGMAPDWMTTNGTINPAEGASNALQKNVWTHYFFQYNPDSQAFTIWQNGVPTLNSTATKGTLNHTFGDDITIG